MHISSDVLVIGCGITGLIAALRAADLGAGVTLCTKGNGTLAISSNCIDLLGANGGHDIADPWAALPELDSAHPYRLLGTDVLENALDFFCSIAKKHGITYTFATSADGLRVNTLLPTILGTLKPSYLIPSTFAADKLFRAKRVLVCGVEGLRDLSPKLCADMLKRNEELAACSFTAIHLPQPFEQAHRGISALDLARLVNTEEGVSWLSTSLGRFARAYDVILLPPILGTVGTEKLHADLERMLETDIVELLSVPPGVGGVRLYEIFKKELAEKNIRLFENLEIKRADTENGRCLAVHANGDTMCLQAKAYVVATGGILGGGVVSDAKGSKEAIFGLPLKMPEGDRAALHALDAHPLSLVGIATDSSLRPLDTEGNLVADNVFFAGRTLANYDPIHEKSGHGVALATGWFAGTKAAELLGMEKQS